MLPDLIAIDEKGYWWRIYDRGTLQETWSMVPTNPDNSPVPQPIKYYKLVEVTDV